MSMTCLVTSYLILSCSILRLNSWLIFWLIIVQAILVRVLRFFILLWLQRQVSLGSSVTNGGWSPLPEVRSPVLSYARLLT